MKVSGSAIDGSVRAAIFDMDGLLIDSEPFWRRAEKDVFSGLGVPMTDEMCESIMGRRTDEVVRHWHRLYQWSGPTVEEVGAEITSRVQRQVEHHGRALAGVHATIAALRERGLMLAVASSSCHTLIDAVVSKLGLNGYFTVICSAVDEERGKPDPAVYLSAARRLGVPAEECVVFEDSVAGTRAAVAAGMKVIAVPAAKMLDDPGFLIADATLSSLEAFTIDMLDVGSANQEGTCP